MTTLEDDARPPAVRAAETAANAWREAAVHEVNASLRHADFYGLAAELVTTLYSLDDLTVTLAAQVGRYGDGRRLFDDTRTVNPGDRLAEAVEQLRATRTSLVSASRSANEFWSALGHIGVEVDR